MQGMATQMQVRSTPLPLNSHICAYIDRSQLPVKCHARLDISIGIRPNVVKPPEACMLRGPHFVNSPNTPSLSTKPLHFSSHRLSSMLMSSGVHSLDEERKRKLSLLLFSPWPPLVCCPAGCDPWPPDPHSWPLDPFPRHAFLCPPCHGNTLVTAAATVTDGQGPGNNFIQEG